MSESTESVRGLDSLEDRIRQQRAVDNRPVLVVEGPSDLLMLREHLPNVLIFPADGKVNALRTVAMLVSWGFADVVAVVDRDFESSDEIDALSTVVHPYEYRDLEGMLVELGVLAHLLEHRSSRVKLAAYGGADKLVQYLKEIVAPMSALRLGNNRENLTLSFDRLDLALKVDKKTLEFDIEAYCAALVAVSDTLVDVSHLSKMSVDVPSDGLGPRGKDVVAAAGVALRFVVGDLPLEATREAGLTSQLHSSAAFALSKSSWLEDLRKKLLPHAPSQGSMASA